MDPQQLLKNRLFKTIGMVFILYLIIFSNKENPNSVGHHLSTKNLKDSLEQAKEQAKMIKQNLKKAEDISATSNNAPLNMATACGDEVDITYKTKENGVSTKTVTTEKLIIGSNKNLLMEQKILGAQLHEMRKFTITQTNKDITKPASTIDYEVIIQSLKKSVNPSIICNFTSND